MRIDWKALPGGIEAFDWVPPPTDWADPTHVPLMVADAIEEIGNLSSAVSDDEYDELQVIALDAMPDGEGATRAAVQRRVREIAAEYGWSDLLWEPGTNKYPWEET